MRYSFWFFVLFFSTGELFGQRYIKGIVVDSLTHRPLEYVTVVNLNSGKGDVTDESGRFELLLSSLDGIEFSNMGYKTKLITSLKDNEQVALVEQPILISEVAVRKRDLRKHSIDIGFHNEETRSTNWGAGGEVPNIFVVHIKNNGLEGGNVQKAYFKLGKYIIGRNRSSKARVRLYSVDDKTGLPGVDLLRENVVVNINPFSQSFSINLERYDIPFLKEGVFVGLEFLCHTERKPLGKGKYSISTNCPHIASTIVKDYENLGKSYIRFYYYDKHIWEWKCITNGEYSKAFKGDIFQFGAKVVYYD